MTRNWIVGTLCSVVAFPAAAESVTFNRVKLSTQGIHTEYEGDITGQGYNAGIEVQASLTQMFVLEAGVGQKREFFVVSGEEYTLVENYYAYGARAVFGIGSGDMAFSLAARAYGGELASDEVPLVGSETEVGYRWAEIGLHNFLLGPWSEGSIALRRYMMGGNTQYNTVNVEYLQGATRLLFGVQGEVALDLSTYSAGLSLNYAL
ncbi:MAG: hypothetical protein JXQ97_04260 [Natronospirillum sp.]